MWFHYIAFYLQWLSLLVCLIPVCHTDLSGSAGLFTSENFPENHKASTNCTWNITVPEGQRVQLTFHLLNVSITSKSVVPNCCIFQPAFGCCPLQMQVKICFFVLSHVFETFWFKNIAGERLSPRKESLKGTDWFARIVWKHKHISIFSPKTSPKKAFKLADEWNDLRL